MGLLSAISTHSDGGIDADLHLIASGVMDVSTHATSAWMSDRRPAMTTTKTTLTTRRCIGSKRFGIEPHEAPVDDFPKQPSQKDGLGRMCIEHWQAYTVGLRRDALARKAKHAQSGS